MPEATKRVQGEMSKERSWLYYHSNLFLLIALLLHVIMQPFFISASARGFLGAMTTLILITSVYSLNDQRRNLIIPIVLGTPFFISIWAQVLTSNSTTTLFQNFSGFVFLGFTTVVLMRQVLCSERVTIETLYGAACVYLLFGFTWNTVYILAETLQPGSFQGFLDPDNLIMVRRDLLYFSFVTLTSLGYGDITPVSPTTKSLSIVEAITGTLYLTFLVARLVAMYMIHSRIEKL